MKDEVNKQELRRSGRQTSLMEILGCYFTPPPSDAEFKCKEKKKTLTHQTRLCIFSPFLLHKAGMHPIQTGLYTVVRCLIPFRRDGDEDPRVPTS